MYRKIAMILFPVVLIAFVITGVWGYKESQDKNAILIQTEAQYQRAFHDLNAQMSHLEDELGKTMVANSNKQMSDAMENVWRLSYATQSDIGQLPITLMPFDKVEQFIARLGKFSHQVANRNLDEKPLTETEWKRLGDLHKRSGQMRKDMGSLQAKVINQNLRWMDVEQAYAAEDENLDNSIIDGFTKINETVSQYSEVDWGPEVNQLQIQNKVNEGKLSGKKVSEADVKQKMIKVLGLSSDENLTVTRNKKGDYETYGVHYKGENKKEINADVTVVGGHLVWMMLDRPMQEVKINHAEAEQKATQFLERLGYEDMETTSYDESDNTVIFTLATQRGDITVYPETLHVKVALDNGEIMGLDADEYIFNQIEAEEKEPTLSEDEARKRVNSHLKIEQSGLAYIYNEAGTPVLCHEFLGSLGNNKYRVFINADSGEEELIQKVESA